MNPSPIDFETWARLSAQLLGESPGEQARIVADAGWSELWPQANRSWNEALSADALARRPERIARYGAICDQAPRRVAPICDSLEAYARRCVLAAGAVIDPLEAYWNERFAAHPEDRSTWIELFTAIAIEEAP
jgi:hypothetical protein